MKKIPPIVHFVDVLLVDLIIILNIYMLCL